MPLSDIQNVLVVGLLLLNDTSGLTSEDAAVERMLGLRSLEPPKAGMESLAIIGLRSLADIPNEPELFLLSIAAEG